MTGTPRAPWTAEQDKKLRALVLSASSVDTICQGSKPDHFCSPSQGKHPEAAIEKDCDASQNDLIRMIAGASFLHALCGPALARHGVPSITVLVLGPDC
jgi:hypothetical protein